MTIFGITIPLKGCKKIYVCLQTVWKKEANVFLDFARRLFGVFEFSFIQCFVLNII